MIVTADLVSHSVKVAGNENENRRDMVKEQANHGWVVCLRGFIIRN